MASDWKSLFGNGFISYEPGEEPGSVVVHAALDGSLNEAVRQPLRPDDVRRLRDWLNAQLERNAAHLPVRAGEACPSQPDRECVSRFVCSIAGCKHEQPEAPPAEVLPFRRPEAPDA